MELNFDNRYLRELPGDDTGHPHSRQTQECCWATVQPTRVARPALLACSSEMLAELDLSVEDVHSEEFLAAFSGNRLLPGMQPYAACYGGHQFGNWAGQLGDGRAISLGEVKTKSCGRLELQLKGAGATPYSRRADGRAVLRSSIREFLCSEAMHHLGVPTTRALSLISTGESVVRDMFYDGNPIAEPGAIVCRVSPSFIRFGSFELPASRGEYELLRNLINFTIERDFPEIVGDNRFENWFFQVCERTAHLVVEWLRVGFVHGVMNTDNMSILGLTLDYGPYGWVENFDPHWTPNTTDADLKRYCLARQPAIARWNLERLADALLAVAPSRSILKAGLAHFDATLQSARSTMFAAKFGLINIVPDDMELIADAYELMHKFEVDMTEFFRMLARVQQKSPQTETLRSAFYQDELYLSGQTALHAWLMRYTRRVSAQRDEDRAARMNRVNPRFILRNYLAQQAIDAATAGDLSIITRLMEAARRPYDEDIPLDLTAKRPDWALDKPGCSTLSCSS